MEVYKSGTRVKVNGDTFATVVGHWLEYDTLQYRVVWWHNGERKLEWVYDCEIDELDHTERIDLGFRV